jgi:unsaturated rhamnogalacturonyl hydrolase
LQAGHPQYNDRQEVRRRALAVENAGPCVFVDSVHFHGPFLAALHAATGEERYLQQAEQVIGPQVELLWDEKERLFHHFWIEREDRRNGVLWARGNGWGMLGIVHTLEHLPPVRPLVKRLKNILSAQASRLAELQDESGDWHTVLDDTGAYLESSMAAFVVDGLCRSIRHGWLDEKYLPVVRRAWRRLLTHVRRDGLLEGVSFETFPSTRAEHYRTMPVGAMVPWGQGPLLCAIRSYLQLTAKEAT